MAKPILKTINASELHVDAGFNCRGKIAPIDVVELAKDIELHGLIQPITVSPYDDAEQERTGYKYRLVAGFRRTAATFVVLKRTTILAIINDTMQDDTQARIFNLAENIQRKDLNVLQEALAIQSLYNLGIGEEACATALGKSRGWVQIRGMLLRLPKDIQIQCAAGFIKQTQIRDLSTILTDRGEDACFKVAREMKEARIKGEVLPPVVKKKQPLKSKCNRKRPEIMAMIEHFAANTGMGIQTRALAWCAGEITTGDICLDIKELMAAQGIKYVPHGDEG